jgi:hypothetical protein
LHFFAFFPLGAAFGSAKRHFRPAARSLEQQPQPIPSISPHWPSLPDRSFHCAHCLRLLRRHRLPEGPARTLPAVIAKNPKAVEEALRRRIIGQPLPIGAPMDTNVLDPETGVVACYTREGTSYTFREDSHDKVALVETVKTKFGAKTMGLDPKTHNLFADTSDFDPADAAANDNQADSRNVPPVDLRAVQRQHSV